MSHYNVAGHHDEPQHALAVVTNSSGFNRKLWADYRGVSGAGRREASTRYAVVNSEEARKHFQAELADHLAARPAQAPERKQR